MYLLIVKFHKARGKVPQLFQFIQKKEADVYQPLF